MLFFANNVLFWIPGHYDWFNFVAAAVAVLIAAISAWFSGKIFSGRRVRERGAWQEMLKAPPGDRLVFRCACVLSRVIDEDPCTLKQTAGFLSRELGDAIGKPDSGKPTSSLRPSALLV